MKNNSILFGFFLLLLGFASCVDNVIDEPPIKEAPTVETNATIADVKAKLILGSITEITDDLIFDAVVVADDETGNFYKTLVVQDETGGISVRIEANNLYTILPIGREVFIKAKDLFIGDYNGLPQLGYANDNGDLLTIPFPLVDDENEDALIIPGRRDQEVPVTTATINTLGNAAINTLIKLEDVQFTQAEFGQTYADAINEFSLNRTLEDCEGNTVVIRTSGFSSFAGTVVPEGNGDLTAVYSIFGSTKQLLLRSPADAPLTETRCDGQGNPNAPEPNATIADVMALYSSGSVNKITTDIVFDATVTADDQTGNFYKQLVLEDETGAINIQLDGFDLFQNYPIGRTVVVKAMGLAVGDYNGLPQIGVEASAGEISRIPESAIASTVFKGTSGSDLPGVVRSINDLTPADYNKLIVLNDVEFASSSLGDTYADAANQFAVNHDLVDCDGNAIIFRTSGFADFAGFTLPSGNGTVKAIFSVFGDTKQLLIRQPQDVILNGERCDGSGGGGGGDAVEEVSEDFEGAGIGVDVAIEGWTNELVEGSRLWRTKEFDGNIYVQATAFQADDADIVTYLVTPAIKMNGNNTLSFRSAMAYHEHDGLSVLVSTNYSGDANAATWIDLGANLAGSSQGNFDWVESGNIDLSSYSGEIHIAFKYEGTSASNTTTYIIDDVVVTK